MSPLPRLMGLTPGTLRDGDAPEPLIAQLQAALEAGLRLVQLRERALSAPALAALWHALAPLRQRFPRSHWLINCGTLPIDAVLALDGLHGIHLPEAAATASGLQHARRSLGSHRLLCSAVHSTAGATTATANGADLLVFAPVFDPTSKPGVQGTGLEPLRATVAVAHPTPVYALGGITAERLPDVLAAGAHGVAVLGTLATRPAHTTRQLLGAMMRDA